MPQEHYFSALHTEEAWRLTQTDRSAASADLLTRLYHHATQPGLCCRWRWQAGDFAIWDNRTTLHYAVNDYDGYRRLLYRTSFGD
ncbi:MAG: TauD/TfdA dioxygenase family protein [Thalassobaculaceae bacterium]